MKFDKNSIPQNEDTTERKTLPAGTYRFRVENATRKQSKKGSLMWEVQLSFPDQSDARWVYEYFVETEKNLWKFVQFFDSIGVEEEDTDAMKYVVDEEGEVTLVVEHSDEYGDRNRVKRFVPKKKKEEPKAPVLDNGDLPF